MKFAPLLLAATLFSVGQAYDCPGDDDRTCIETGRACTGSDLPCCGAEDDDEIMCLGFNFHKVCRPRQCLDQWWGCTPPDQNPDGPFCCNGYSCQPTKGGNLFECQKETPETRMTELPGFEVDPPPEDPPKEPTELPVLPGEKWVGCISGDPHIDTFDGLDYDCQGVGEFTVLKSLVTGREIQGRFTQFKEDISVMKGMVVRDQGESGKVQLTIDSYDDNDFADEISGCKVHLFVNNEQVRLDALPYNDEGVSITLENGKNVRVEYDSTGLEVTTTINKNCRFNFCVHVPPGDPTSVGLLGSPDDDPSNEWMTAVGGPVVAEGARVDRSRQGAYDYCTTHHCIKEAGKSLFKYDHELNRDWSDFYDCGIPYATTPAEFLTTVTEEVLTKCGKDIACITDAQEDGLEDALKALKDRKEALKGTKSPKNGKCGDGFPDCKEGLRCIDLGGLAGKICSDKWTFEGCKKEQYGCDPAGNDCCSGLTCQTLNAITMCQDNGAECKNKGKQCDDHSECCDQHRCVGKKDNKKSCQKIGEKSKEGEKCYPEQGQLCEDGLFCDPKKGRCKVLETCQAKKNKPCKMSHDQKLDCCGDMKCLPDKKGLKWSCKKFKEGEDQCIKKDYFCNPETNADDPPACCKDDNACLWVQSDDEEKEVSGFRCVKTKSYSESSKSVKGTDLETLVNGVPTAKKCVLKRSSGWLVYEPDFPALRPDVFLQVMTDEGLEYSFYPKFYNGTKLPLGEDFELTDGKFPIVNQTVFQILYDSQEKEGGTGFKFRFFSKNGPGAWNSCKYSPIALDLDGDGSVSTITRPEGYWIDITGDGDKNHLSSWFGPKEGILVDLKGVEMPNGITAEVIDGKEMIGDMGGQYSDGYEKLAQYDLDGDEELTGDELNTLYLWVDSNSDLKMEAHELKTLAEYNIVSLPTTHDKAMMSYAKTSDGKKILMQDLWFSPYGARRH